MDKVVQDRIDGDADFQATLTDLSEDDKNAAIASKRKDVLSEEIATLTKRATDAETLAGNQKTRAEKAEGKIKENASDLSAKDAMLLAKANVDLEDVDEVVEYAKFKKVPIADALKSPVLIGIIAERKEERATAEATATGKNTRSTAAPSADAILAAASGGQVPDDDAGITALVNARIAGKSRKN